MRLTLQHTLSADGPERLDIYIYIYIYISVLFEIHTKKHPQKMTRKPERFTFHIHSSVKNTFSWHFTTAVTPLESLGPMILYGTLWHSMTPYATLCHSMPLYDTL